VSPGFEICIIGLLPKFKRVSALLWFLHYLFYFKLTAECASILLRVDFERLWILILLPVVSSLTTCYEFVKEDFFKLPIDLYFLYLKKL